MKILDLGCGHGNNKHKIYNNNEYQTYGVDIEQDNIDFCKEKFPNSTFIKIGGETLPFDNNYFDIIHSLDVLEHVDDLDQVLKEATRVLKKGGKFIIEVPYWKSEERLLKIKPSYWKQVHHVRMFKDGEMEKLLDKFGFEFKKRKRIKFFDNIVLSYLLKNGNIKSQKGDFDIMLPYYLILLGYLFDKNSVLTNLSYKTFILLPFFILNIPIKILLDYMYPKSIYFEFIKK